MRSRLHSKRCKDIILVLLAAIVLTASATGCKDNDNRVLNRAKEKPSAPSVFRCLKVTRGGGRYCAGPGFVPTDGSDASRDEDLFDSGEAWCYVTRVSWTDSESQMRCLPTEAECTEQTKAPTKESRLTIGSDATPFDTRAFVRQPCTRTAPTEWAKGYTPWHGTSDGFICNPVRAAKGSAEVTMCAAVPAEVVRGAEIHAQAWCFAYTYKSTPPASRAFCFLAQRDCEGQRVRFPNDSGSDAIGMLDKQCTLEGPQRELEHGPMSADIRKQLGH